MKVEFLILKNPQNQGPNYDFGSHAFRKMVKISIGTEIQIHSMILSVVQEPVGIRNVLNVRKIRIPTGFQKLVSGLFCIQQKSGFRLVFEKRSKSCSEFEF